MTATTDQQSPLPPANQDPDPTAGVAETTLGIEGDLVGGFGGWFSPADAMHPEVAKRVWPDPVLTRFLDPAAVLIRCDNRWFAVISRCGRYVADAGRWLKVQPGQRPWVCGNCQVPKDAVVDAANLRLPPLVPPGLVPAWDSRDGLCPLSTHAVLEALTAAMRVMLGAERLGSPELAVRQAWCAERVDAVHQVDTLLTRLREIRAFDARGAREGATSSQPTAVVLTGQGSFARAQVPDPAHPGRLVDVNA